MDSYNLTAVQEGMLYHYILGESRGVDIEQISIRLHHPLDNDRFLDAWNRLVEQHPVLRASYVWGADKSATQHFNPTATLAAQIHDKSQLTLEEFDREFAAFKAADRLRNFDLSNAPLMRLVIFQAPQHQTVCLWTFHHLILDGRSFPILLDELFAAYAALEKNQLPAFADRPNFSDYLDWYASRDRTGEREFWAAELSGVHGSVPLNFDSTMGKQEGRFLASERRLAEAESGILQSFALEAGVTTSTLLQAAWALLMHHYTREEDLVFGSTRACRHGSIAQADQIVGMLINTVPMRVCFDDKTPLRELLTTIRRKHLAVREYEFTPLADIRRYAGIGTEHIFESLVVYDNMTLNDALQLRGGDWQHREFDYQGQTNFPLALVAYGGRQLTIRLEYDGGKYSTGCITGLLDNLICLLRNFPDNASATAVKIPYIPETQKLLLLGGSIQPSVDSSPDLCLHQRFALCARSFPDRIALSFEQQFLSYQELDNKADQLAQVLIQNSVRAGDLVGLCLERSNELIIGLLAILKSGAAYVPLDPSYPAERLSWIVEDAGIQQVLSRASVMAKLPEFGGAVTLIDVACLETDRPGVTGRVTQPEVPVSALAYVIYTSGSTGKPKGVKVSHANVVRLFDATDHWFHFDQNDVWTLFHSTAFDFSVWEIWGALLYGGRLLVVPYWVSRAPDKFHRLVIDESVTVLNQTPSAFRQFMSCALGNGQLEQYHLRYVVFGGEALDLQSLEPWVQAFGDQQPKLINMYGITETTVHVTYRRITEHDITDSRGSLIGMPIPDLQIYLLNEWMQPVPPGIVGEMYVGGAGVAEGYLNREALTAERFLVDPFADSGHHPTVARFDAGQRLYKTGDLARMLPDGGFEYLGRSDFQVKVRGFRIETGEIESALSQHAAIKQAVVNTFAGPDRENRLVAYLLYAGHQPLANSELRDYLLKSLPEYMVPALFTPVETIPLTHNGKIDRRALPDPVVVSIADTNRVAAKTDTEKLLVAVWQSVLGVAEVGIQDNYFDLGGDSILTIKMVAALREQGYAVSPRQIFEYKTIERLAPYLQPLAAQVVCQERVQGEVPLLPAQQWFFSQRFANPHHWNQAFVFDIDGVLDADKLNRAFGKLSAHHDVLNASYTQAPEGWRQSFGAGSAFFRFEFMDLSNIDPLETDRRLTEYCYAQQQALEISQGKLASVVLFNMQNNTSKLFICMHHLVMDGVSWGILLEDLVSLYRAEESGGKAELPARTESLQTWHQALRNYARSASSSSNLAYWQNLNVAQVPAQIPAQITAQMPGWQAPRNPQASTEAQTRTVKGALGQSLTAALLTSANTPYGTRINDLLLTALGMALQRQLAVDQVLVDMEGHGREECVGGLNVSRTIGWFTCIYPVLLAMHGERSLSDQILAVKENLRSVSNNGLDYFIAAYLPGAEGKPHLPELPKSPILFNYLGQFDQLISGLDTWSFSALDTGNWHGNDNQRTHPLEIISVVHDEQLEVSILYSQSEFADSEVAQLKDAYLDALASIVEHCSSVQARRYSPADFPLLELNQQEIDKLQSEYDLIDIYPLSPMQSLFYSADILDPAQGFEQWVFKLDGALDPQRYQNAWQCVTERHDILRTAVLELDNGSVCQLVCRNATPAWQYLDFSAQSQAQQTQQLQHLLDEDRSLHFNLAAAPLIRITLVKLAEAQYQLVWSTHHLCVDGWSWPLIFRDIAEYYRQSQFKGERQSAQFGQYINWLHTRRQRFLTEATDKRQTPEQFWREELAEFNAPLLFARLQAKEQTQLIVRQYKLDSPLAEALSQYCADHRLTLNTLLQALLAVVLSRAFEQRDIVFGISSSGRPTELAGVDSVAGPFVNNIPKRIRIPDPRPVSKLEHDLVQADSDDAHRTPAHQPSSVVDWLLAIQSASLEAVAFEYLTPLEIQKLCGFAISQRLFETLLVFQNYDTSGVDRLSEDAASSVPDVTITPVSLPQSTNYPLTLVVKPGADFHITVYLQPSYFNQKDAQDLMTELGHVFNEFAANSDILLKLAGSPGHWSARRRESARRDASHISSVSPAAAIDSSIDSLTDMVSKVWAATFGVDNVDRNQSFFDLGGQSVQLVSMHAELQRILDRQFPVTLFFKYPTITTLSHFLEYGEQAVASVSEQHKNNQQNKQSRKQAARRNRRARSGRKE